MRNRKLISTATKVATASSNGVQRVDYTVTTDERILQLRKDLGLNPRIEAKYFAFRTQVRANMRGLLN